MPVTPTSQATVWSFDDESHDGVVVLDDGTRLPFDATAFAASGLRLLRPGQRVRITITDAVVSALTILTLTPPYDAS